MRRIEFADFVAGARVFAEVADYLTINVSSPNTPGLRDLQTPQALRDLLERVGEARAAQEFAPPLLLKIAPDLGLAELDGVVRAARDAKIDGMIISNTTVARPPGLRSRFAREAGGLSGAPLFARSTRLLAHCSLRVEGQFPLVGVGGVDGPDSALAKIEAGASLVQLYTALIYAGPGVTTRIKDGIAARLAQDKTTLTQLVGRRAREIAEG